jgi:hypothetical protein
VVAVLFKAEMRCCYSAELQMDVSMMHRAIVLVYWLTCSIAVIARA